MGSNPTLSAISKNKELVSKFSKVDISCTSREEIQEIAKSLLGSRLVACVDEPVENQSNYWWNEKIERETRYQITALSSFEKRDLIIRLVKEHHSDETPGIVFSAIDANQEFLDWIEGSIK